jgi:phosphatidylglycerophosphate synthase
VDLYRSKRAAVRALEPVVGVLARAGISPDTVTVAAVPVGLAAGVCLVLSPRLPALLILVPLLAGLRLILNLLDGALARATGRSHPRGELLNEVADRLADIAFLAPVAVLPGADPTVVLLGVLGAVVASFIGVAARAAGGERIYRGVLSKPGRMILLAVSSIGALVAGPAAWSWFGPVLVIGTTLTAAERLVVALRRLA